MTQELRDDREPFSVIISVIEIRVKCEVAKRDALPSDSMFPTRE